MKYHPCTKSFDFEYNDVDYGGYVTVIPREFGIQICISYFEEDTDTLIISGDDTASATGVIIQAHRDDTIRVSNNILSSKEALVDRFVKGFPAFMVDDIKHCVYSFQTIIDFLT